ncbi:tape measure protein [Oceanobacillus caeni]|uniref:tape measure protein n=1 Tax=Oceanobacillus caeni TaxID=405946 RepID=UPI0036385A96
MATIRELQASFVAKVSGMKSAIQGVKKDINSLESSSGKTAGKMSTNFSSVGKTLTNFGNGLQQASQKVGTLGKSLTKKITLPAAGAATAIGGITAALGWKRLVGLDSAQAQLKGLGYNTKEVGRISKQVTKAIDGGMTTMAEGTSVAAGALAAGVKEGAELERYIKLVGDAAVGANRPVGDMAQIFNRVQGSGKLMTQELNMIEDGMPGFAQAMAKNLNVSQEEFRKMVTDGKVNSKKFLDVMEDFAGGMASAYSDSWQGMVANTKAYIGIIGENLLGGVFEKSKESIAEFIEFLKSDEVVAWAQKVGKQIGVMFSLVVDKVQSAIQWFANLSKSQQSMIMKFGAVALAAGPILVVLGTLGGIIGKLSAGLGTLITPLSKAKGAFGLLSTTAADGTKKVGLLSRTFTLLTGPVGITIGIIAALVTGFITAYKKSETFRNFVDKLKDAFVNAYEKIKEFLTTNETLLGFIDNIKKGFEILRKKVSEAIKAIVDFFQDKIAEMRSFWDSEGSSFLKAFSNIFSGIRKVTEPVIKFIVSLIQKSLPVITTVFSVTFKAAYEIVKSIWQNIRGVIDGGLKIIMGLIRVFSGIFTGDFSKMWQGIKDIFSGAIQFIWNFVQLMFWGKLLKGVVGFVKGFSKPIGAMWTSIKDLFSRVINWIVEFVKNSFTKMKDTIAKISSGIQKGLDTAWNFILNIIKKVVQTIVNFVKNRFTTMKNGITTIFNAISKFISTVWNAILSFFKTVIKAIVDFVKSRFTTLKNNVTTIFNAVKKFITNVWNAIYSFFKTVIKSIVDFVKNRFTSLYNNTKSIFTNVWNFIKDIWSKVYNNTKNSVSNIFNKVRDTWNNLKSKTTEIFKGIRDGIKQKFDDIVDAAKKLPKRIGDGIGNMASKVTDGVNKVVNKLASKLGDGVNGVIGGINWVLKRIGVDEKNHIDEWPVPKYKKGTKGHPGGLAVVGDGGQSELIQTPDGEMMLSPNTDTLLNLPKGTAVLSGDKTKKFLSNVPMYAKGIGDIGISVAKGVKKAGKKVAEWTGNVWSYIKEPKKLLNVALKALGVEMPKGGNFIGDIAKAGFSMVKDKAVGFIKDKMENLFGGGDIPNVSGSGVQRWAGIARQALMMTNQYTEANLKRLLYQMKTESGGNPKAINLWDINAKRGIPSKGLMQVIDPTFQAYKMPGFNNIWNPLDNILASIRYAVSRYGSLARAYRGVGYADGGIVDTKQLAWIAEGGWAESIISHDPSKRVRQQRIWQETGDRLGFTDDKYSKQMLAELERIARSVEAGQRNITKAIENKPVLSGSDIKQEYDRRDSKEAINHSIFTGRPRR